MKPGSGSIRKSKHWRYHHGRQIRQVGIGMSKPVSHKIPASSSHCWLFLDINATSTGSESTRINTSRAASIASKLRQNAPPRRFMVCAFGGNNRDISIGETSQQNCKNRVNAKQGGSSRLELSHRSRSPDQSSWVGSVRDRPRDPWKRALLTPAKQRSGGVISRSERSSNNTIIRTTPTPRCTLLILWDALNTVTILPHNFHTCPGVISSGSKMVSTRPRPTTLSSEMSCSAEGTAAKLPSTVGMWEGKVEASLRHTTPPKVNTRLWRESRKQTQHTDTGRMDTFR